MFSSVDARPRTQKRGMSELEEPVEPVNPTVSLYRADNGSPERVRNLFRVPQRVAGGGSVVRN